VNTRIGSPMRTRIVGPMSPFCCSAVEAAVCPPPRMTEAPLELAAASPPITYSSIAEPNRWKKCVSTLPGSPPLPSNAVAGEASATEMPSGRISRVQIT